MDQTITVTGIDVENITLAQALESIGLLLTAKKGSQVCFVNAEAVVLARHNNKYKEVLTRASLRLVDGSGMHLAARLQGKQFAANLNGTDLFGHLCTLLNAKSGRVFLLGGKPEMAKKTGDWIRTNYPNVQIVGTRHGYFAKKEEPEVVMAIRSVRPDILLVGLGAPYQDIWIYNHLDQIGTKVAMGVGGLFDFYSRSIQRAPIWMRTMGIEWLWRVLLEPRRWKRIMRLFEFFWVILIYKK